MDSPIEKLFYNFSEEIITYLPHLVAGIVLIGLGWLVGWFAKRVTVQLCAVLRFDRMLRRFNWGKGLGRADVRYAFYNSLGNLVFAVIFLIFLNNALSVMRLTILSDLLEMGIFFLPRVIAALIIFAIGWFIAWGVSGAMQKALIKEEIPRATLIARFTKAVLVLFFSTMALTELDIAREIVIIGFTTIIITLGIIAIVFIAKGGRAVMGKILDTLEED